MEGLHGTSPLPSAKTHDTALYGLLWASGETFFWKAILLFRLWRGARATCRIFGPLWGRKTNTGGDKNAMKLPEFQDKRLASCTV
ncbi:MAG: hypothetical protein DLM68_01845 [Hyphomicrobiales bacterium]|nr:MAG: hypothetical protein DLM68_01845 [Hyphomicrobiales bacterium]